jgi:tetratricopeptide (TPR) repeat protein
MAVMLCGVIGNGFAQQKADNRKICDSLQSVAKTLSGEEQMNMYTILAMRLFAETDVSYCVKLLDEYGADAHLQKNYFHEANSMIVKLRVFYNHFDTARFEQEYQKCATFSKKHKLYDALSAAFDVKIHFLCNMQRFEEALSETQKMYEFAKEKKNDRGLYYTNLAFGNIYDNFHRYTEAKKYLYAAIEYQKK